MNLQHTKPGNRIEKVKTAAKAFVAATLLTATIFGCDAEKSMVLDAKLPPPMETAKNNSLAVKCAPCPDCTVPRDASLLRERSVIGTNRLLPDVLVLRGIGRSEVEARYEKIAADLPRSETETFTTGPGQLCIVTVSGKEIYDVFKPGAFLVEPGWVYLSSRRTKLYVPVQK